MSQEEALKKLKELIPDGDTEAQHAEADAVLFEFVRSLGYVEIAEAYDAVEKWYA